MQPGISSGGLVAVEWSLLSVAFLLIIARLHLRLYHLGKRIVVSDWFIIAAFISGLSIGAVDIVLHGRGVYEPWIDFSLMNWEASEEELIQALKIFYGLYFPFYLEQYFNKGALLALYYEVLARQSRRLRIALYCLTVYCLIGFLTTIFMILFLSKLSCYWSLTATCPDYWFKVNDNLGWAFHFTSDICIFLLPLIYISQTNMTKAQKISAGVTFSLGFINISVMFARWWVVQAVFTPSPALTTGQALAVADGHTGLIIAILPSLRPYLKIWQGADLSSRPTELISKSRRTFSMSDRTASTVRTECYASRNSNDQSKDSSSSRR